MVEDEHEEESIRKAVAVINGKVKLFAENYNYKDNQDLLAMVCLDTSTTLLQGSGISEAEKKQLKDKIENISALL